MEKKEYTPVVVVAVAVAICFGFAACGVACFTLAQSSSGLRRDLSEARQQLLAQNQALSDQRHDLSEARGQLAAANDKLADAQKSNHTLNKELTDMRSKLRESEEASAEHFQHFDFSRPVVPREVAAADSIEGQLRADGKRWEMAPGPIVEGVFVQDTLEGRLNQPKGRGCLGKVVSMEPFGDGRLRATVDFGRGFLEAIFTSELSPIHFVGPEVR
jgi:hypothetical protein